MSKKKHDVMAKEREYFIHGQTDEDGNITVPGAVRNGIPEDIAGRIFDEMSAFASYAFNKPHAAGYAIIAVQTAWLKVNHPVQFMAALMNSVTGNTGKIAQYIQYCRKHDIAVLPPDVNNSRRKFSVDKDPQTGKAGIRFGLGAVKGAGGAAVDAIVKERQLSGPFRDIYDFARRATDERLNKRVAEGLIKAGAFDGTGANRAQLLDVYENAMEGAAQVRKRNIAGQMSLFEGFAAEEPLESTSPSLPPLGEFPLRELLAQEKEVTGVYITGHPLDEYSAAMEQFEYTTAFLEELSEHEDHGIEYDGRRIRMGGILSDVRGKATRSGTMMGFVVLEDLTGQIEGLVFPKIWERIGHSLHVDQPSVLSGRLSIREDEAAKIIVDEILPLEKTVPEHVQELPIIEERVPPLPPARLYIRIDSRARMDEALSLLATQRGSSPVMFRIEDEGITLRAPEQYWCHPDSELIQTLCGCYGTANVKLVEQGGAAQ